MKHTERTKHRITILLATFLGFASVVAGLYSWRKHRLHVQTAQWREQGLSAQRNADYAQAVEKLALYLSRAPEDREALVAFIDARPHVESPRYQHLVETARAIKFLLQQDPSLIEQRIKLLDLYRRMGLRSEAVETADAILKQQPANAIALETKTRALIDLKRDAQALVAARQWAAAQPLDPIARINLYSLMAQAGGPADEILADADAWGKEHPSEQAQFDLFKGLAYSAAQDRANAAIWLRKAAAFSPPDDAFAQILLQQIVIDGDAGEDISILRDMVTRGAGPSIRQILLRRLWEQSQWKEVADVSQKINFADSATSLDAMAMTCLAQSSLGNEAQVKTLRQALADRNDPVARAWTSILGANTLDSADNRALAEQCRRALERQPGDSYIRYFLGEALLRLGETDLALEAWQQVADSNLTWGLPLSRSADVMLENGDAFRATPYAAAGFRRGATMASAMSLANVAVNQAPGAIATDAVQKLIDQIDQAIPGNLELSLLRVQFLAAGGQKERAIDLIEKILSGPSDPGEPALMHLAAISEAGKLGLEARILAADERLHGVSPQLALRRALAAPPAEGIKLFDEAMAKSDARNRTQWELARATHLDRANLPEAKTQWKALCDQQPRNVAIQQAALKSAALHGDRAFGEQTIQRLQSILGPGSLVCSMARVRLLVDTRAGDADDRELAQRLTQVTTAHPALLEPRVLWAQSLERAGKIEEAIDQLQLAQTSNPNSTGLALRLASLYFAKADDERARQQLDRLSPANLHAPAEARLASHLLSQEGDYAKAALMIEPLTNQNANDGLLLADLYWRQNKIDQTQALIERLLKTPSPDIIEFAARFNGSQGKFSAAESALALLDILRVEPGRAPLVRANYFATIGNAEAAIAQYRLAIQAAPRDSTARRCLIAYLLVLNRANDALAAIHEGVGQNPLDSSLLEIQKHAPALLQIAPYKELHPLLLDYLKGPNQNARTLDVIGQVAAAMALGDPKQQVPPARLIAQRYPRLQGVQLWAIRVYLRAGNTADAGPAIDRAMETFALSAEVAGVASSYFAAAGQWDRSLDAARQWRARGNDALRADTAIARALIELKRPAEAVSQLDPYLSTARTAPDDYRELLFNYATAQCANGKSAAAAKMLFPLAKASPSWRIACLQLAAQKLDDAEAQDWLRRLAPMMDAASTEQTTLLAEAWAAVGTRHSDLENCITEAKRLFGAVEGRSDVSPAQLEQAGIFAEQIGDSQKAVMLYKRSVTQDPHRSIAQNNLAMLLAANADDLDEAAIHASAALKANPNAPEFLDTLAYVKAKAGDVKTATQCLRRAVDLDSSNVRWSLNLAELLASHGQNDEAAKVIAAVDAKGTDVARLSAAQQSQLAALRQRVLPAESSVR